MQVQDRLISVIITSYNREAFIEEAIYSILNQTYTNLELIVVNDCSTDKTEQKVFAIKDPRIRYFKNTQQLGPGKSRNVGLQNAKGDFITIMDSDDISVPQRLEWQVSFLQNNPEIDLVSGAMKTFGNSAETLVAFPQSVGFIKCWLLFKNCLPNIVMFRRELLDTGLFSYNDFWFAEDFYLWHELTKKGYTITTLPHVLLHCRIHENRITNTALKKREEDMNLWLEERIYERLGIEIPAEHFHLITTFIHTRIKIKGEDFDVLMHFFTNLYMENKRRKIYASIYFAAVLYFYFLRLGKYYYLEKRKPLQFLKYFAEVVYMLGLKSFYIFLRNNKGYR
ncbi:MAG: glycosyltransferase family 2 protein [Bacteroidia bacterium]